YRQEASKRLTDIAKAERAVTVKAAEDWKKTAREIWRAVRLNYPEAQREAARWNLIKQKLAPETTIRKLERAVRGSKDLEIVMRSRRVLAGLPDFDKGKFSRKWKEFDDWMKKTYPN